MHGHGIYDVKHSKTLGIPGILAKHGYEDPGTTYKYYSKLSHNDIRDVILKMQ